jgi:hypothetical protein
VGFEPWSGQVKDYEIGICCFCANHAALRRKSKDWLARYQNNVSEWSDISTCKEGKFNYQKLSPLLHLVEELDQIISLMNKRIK